MVEQPAEAGGVRRPVGAQHLAAGVEHGAAAGVADHGADRGQGDVLGRHRPELPLLGVPEDVDAGPHLGHRARCPCPAGSGSSRRSRPGPRAPAARTASRAVARARRSSSAAGRAAAGGVGVAGEREDAADPQARARRDRGDPPGVVRRAARPAQAAVDLDDDLDVGAAEQPSGVGRGVDRVDPEGDRRARRPGRAAGRRPGRRATGDRRRRRRRSRGGRTPRPRPGWRRSARPRPRRAGAGRSRRSCASWRAAAAPPSRRSPARRRPGRCGASGPGRRGGTASSARAPRRQARATAGRRRGGPPRDPVPVGAPVLLHLRLVEVPPAADQLVAGRLLELLERRVVAVVVLLHDLERPRPSRMLRPTSSRSIRSARSVCPASRSCVDALAEGEVGGAAEPVEAVEEPAGGLDGLQRLADLAERLDRRVATPSGRWCSGRGSSFTARPVPRGPWLGSTPCGWASTTRTSPTPTGTPGWSSG